MKKTLLIALLMAGTATVFGQGALQWGNTFSGFRSPIYAGDLSQPNGQTGSGSLSTPTGSTVYPGPLLQGSGYTFALFAGSSSATSNQLAFVVGASQAFRTAAANALPAGLVLGGTSTIPGVDAGQQANFQIRAWDNAGGTINDWASALAANRSHGASAIVLSGPLGGIPSTGGSPFTTPATTGWQSFSLTAVPEPSSFALAGLASAAMLILRRRK